MATLHILRSSPTANSAFTDCLALFSPSDTLLLIDDGCYALHSAAFAQAIKNDELKHIQVLEKHQTARGISEINNLTAKAATYNAIDMNGVVDLTLTHDRVVTWQ